MADSKEKLFSNFPPTSTEEWMKVVEKDLKGADFERKLVWKTQEGFNVQPFYRKEDLESLKTTDAVPGVFPYLRGTKKKDNSWYVQQKIEVDTPQVANGKALGLLDRGIDSFSFIIAETTFDGDYIKTLLNNIPADKVELNFTMEQTSAVEFSKLLVEYFESKKYDVLKLKGSIGFDYFNTMLLKGVEDGPMIQLSKKLIETIQPLPFYRVLNVNAITLTNAGSYITQELGYALAWGNEYLRTLTKADLPVAVIAKKIKFNFGVGSNYFLEIAKFRAARMLWANIVSAYKPECLRDCENKGPDNECRCAAKMNMHAETTKYNKTLFDPYVNLLRSQTEAMSAALGGVDSLTILPFDSVYESSDEFSERIARNQQLLLKEESHFDKVVDPAGGSYYIENLTVSIAKVAWDLFLEIENAGGFYKSLREGTIQKALKASNEKRQKAVATRREVLVGTNQFPNFNEVVSEKMPDIIERYKNKEELEETETSNGVDKIALDRASRQFEELRLETESSTKRPVVFMLTIGDLAMRQARAQFSSNFFACAGYKVIDNLGFETVEQGIEAALKAKADIVVLCSSDNEYATYAVPTYKTLDNRALFVVAGAPACMEELKEEGIEHFVHVRVNVLETLQAFNQILLK